MNLDTVIVKNLNVIKTQTLPKIFEVAMRNHHSLSYRIKGKNTIYNGSTKIISDAHSMTFVPANIAYTHHVDTPSEQIVVHFTTKNNIGIDIESFTLPLHCEIETLFYDLYQKWEFTQKESNLECMAAFYNIILLIAKNGALNIPKENKLLDTSMEYMHSHYRESDFNIEKLYQMTYISPSYYRRLFKMVYKCSPIEYLKNLRINYAKQLLKNGYHTVAEIAELSGFSTSTYFSYEFKKMTGYTPLRFRDG